MHLPTRRLAFVGERWNIICRYLARFRKRPISRNSAQTAFPTRHKNCTLVRTLLKLSHTSAKKDNYSPVRKMCYKMINWINVVPHDNATYFVVFFCKTWWNNGITKIFEKGNTIRIVLNEASKRWVHKARKCTHFCYCLAGSLTIWSYHRYYLFIWLNWSLGSSAH